jgi:hypothetical protein
MSVRPTIYPITAIEPIRDALGSRDESLVTRIRETYIRLEEEHYREDELDEETLAEDEEDAFGDEQEPWEIDQDELRLITKQAKAFVNAKFTRNQEPGVWREVIVYLAYTLGLTTAKHPFFGDWERSAWSDYSDRVSEALPEGPRKSLRDLVEGRSLSCRQIDHDGCSYAWLTSSEVSELLAALRKLPESLLCQPTPPSVSAADLLTGLGGLTDGGLADHLTETSDEEPDEDWLPAFHQDLVMCLSACQGQCLFLAG